MMTVSYAQVFFLAGALFLMGAVCAAARRNLVMILMGVEIMLNAAGIAFIGASLRWKAPDGQAFVLFIMAFAATEVAVGLALVVHGRRHTGSIRTDAYDTLKG